MTSTESVGGFAGFGPGGGPFGGNFLRNTSTGSPASPTTLTLTGLPAHTSLSIDFLLATIDSWDGTTGGMYGVVYAIDYFNVTVDGVPVFTNSFGNINGAAPSYVPPPGVSLVNQVNVFETGAFPPGDERGFDSAFDMHFEPSFQNIAHTAGSVTISFFASGGGWQGGTDESWAIDNLSVSVVPEPTSLGLVVAGAGLMARRRRSTSASL